MSFYFRIIPLSRPVMLDRLQMKIKSAFGRKLNVNYVNNAVRQFLYFDYFPFQFHDFIFECREILWLKYNTHVE